MSACTRGMLATRSTDSGNGSSRDLENQRRFTVVTVRLPRLSLWHRQECLTQRHGDTKSGPCLILSHSLLVPQCLRVRFLGSIWYFAAVRHAEEKLMTPVLSLAKRNLGRTSNSVPVDSDPDCRTCQPCVTAKITIESNRHRSRGRRHTSPEPALVRRPFGVRRTQHGSGHRRLL